MPCLSNCQGLWVWWQAAAHTKSPSNYKARTHGADSWQNKYPYFWQSCALLFLPPFVLSYAHGCTQCHTSRRRGPPAGTLGTACARASVNCNECSWTRRLLQYCTAKSSCTSQLCRLPQLLQLGNSSRQHSSLVALSHASKIFVYCCNSLMCFYSTIFLPFRRTKREALPAPRRGLAGLLSSQIA